MNISWKKSFLMLEPNPTVSSSHVLCSLSFPIKHLDTSLIVPNTSQEYQWRHQVCYPAFHWSGGHRAVGSCSVIPRGSGVWMGAQFTHALPFLRLCLEGSARPILRARSPGQASGNSALTLVSRMVSCMLPWSPLAVSVTHGYITESLKKNKMPCVIIIF